MRNIKILTAILLFLLFSQISFSQIKPFLSDKSIDAAYDVHNKGFDYYEKGDNKAAIIYWEQAVPVYIENNDIQNLNIINVNLGLAYNNLKNLPLAYYYYTEALKYAIEYKDNDVLISTTKRLSGFLANNFLYKDAISIVESIIPKINQEDINELQELINNYNDYINQFASATESQLQKFRNRNSLNDEESAKLLYKLSFIYLLENKFDDAISAATRAIEIYASLGNTTEAAEIQKYLIYYFKIADIKQHEYKFHNLNETEKLKLYFPVYRINYLTADSAIIQIKHPSFINISVGTEIEIVGGYLNLLPKHHTTSIAEGRVIESDKFLTTISIKILNTNSDVNYVFIGDAVGLNVNVPKIENRTVLSELARFNVGYFSKDNDPLIYPTQVFLQDGNLLETVSLINIKSDINLTGETIRQLWESYPEYKEKMTGGIFSGLDYADAFEKSTESDIKIYLEYISNYPASIKCRENMFAEWYINWLMNNCPVEHTSTFNELVKITNDIELEKFINSFGESIIDGNHFEEYSELLEKFYYDNQEIRIRVAENTVKVAERLKDSPSLAAAYFLLGRTLYFYNDYENSLKAYNKSAEEYFIINNNTNAAIAQHNVALSFYNLNKYKEAAEWYQKSINTKLELLKKQPERIFLIESTASSYKGLSDSYRKINEFDSSLIYIKKAVELYTKTNNYSQLGSVYFSYGKIYEDQFLWESAATFFQKSVENYINNSAINPTKSNYESIGNALWGVGYNNDNINKYSESLDAYKSAIIYYDSSGSVQSKKDKAVVQKNLAIIYNKYSEYQKAIELYESNVQIYFELGDTLKVADNYDNIAECYYNWSKYRKAIEYYSKGYEYHMLVNDKRGAGYSKSNIGLSYWNIGEFDKAIEANKDAIKLREEVNHIEGLAYSWMKLGQILSESGDATGALDAFDKAQLYNNQVKDDSTLVEIYENLGSLYKTNKDFNRAVEYYNKAIELRTKHNMKFDLAYTLFELAGTYYEFEKFRDAYDYYKKSYDLRKEINDQSGMVNCLANLALITYVIDFNFAEAERMFFEAVDIAKSTNNKSTLAYSFGRLSYLYTEKGMRKESKAYLDSALALCIEIEDKQQTGTFLIDLGYFHLSNGEFEIAKEKFLEAEKIAKEINNNFVLSRAFQAMSDYFMVNGNFVKAIESVEQALNINIKVQNSFGIANSYLSLGNLHNRLGKYKQALEYYTISDSIYEVAKNDYGRSRPLNNIGTIYYWQGDYEPSLKQFDKALEVLRKNDYESDFLGTVIANKGEVYLAMKNYKEAEKYLLEGLRIARNAQEQTTIASILTIVGQYYTETKQFEKAREAFAEAYSLYKKYNWKEAIAYSAGYYGRMLIETNEIDKAKELLNESIQYANEIGVKKYQWEPLYHLAIIYGNENKIDESINLLRESINILETLRSNLAGGEQAQKIFSSGEEKVKIYEKIVSYFIERNQIDSAFFYLDKSNNEALREKLGSVEVKYDNEEINLALEKEKDLRRKKEIIEEEKAKELAKPESERNNEKLQQLAKIHEVAEEEYINFLFNISEEFPELEEHFKDNVNPVDFTRINNDIPEDLAILAYLLGENKIYIFVATKDTVTAKQVEIDQNKFEIQIVQLYRLLKDSSIPDALGELNIESLTVKNEDNELEAESYLNPFKELSSDLYNTLISPILPNIKNKKILSIIPYGKLNYIPFQSLGYQENNKFNFVLNEYDIFYISRLDMFGKQREQIGENLNVLAFGNADNTLPYAEFEVKNIKNRVDNALIFIRDDATKDKIKSIDPTINAIHFATHGSLDYTDPRKSNLTLAANAQTGDNGNLSISEIWGMGRYMRNISLITLSACKTAINEETSKGFIVNPANAFFKVGVSSIVASLWQVDDQATSILMDEFYKNIKTMSIAEALRAAQITLASNPKYAYPYYWAGFILVGDWR